MSKFKGLISTLVSGFIVIFASICLTVFILSPISFGSAFCGLYAGFVLFPAVKEWIKTFNTILGNN